MSKTLKDVLPLAILVLAFELSACATKKEPVAEPATGSETPSALLSEPVIAGDQHRHGLPEGTAEEAATEQPVVTQQPAPEQAAPPVKRKVTKAKRVRPKAPPPPAPEPVAAPVPPVVESAPVVQPPEPEPMPAAPVAPPAQEVAEKGFLEQYWLWLLGLVVAIVGIIVWRLKGEAGKS